MAEATSTSSSVTEDGLKAALIDKLQATHVEIEDMSGGCGQAFSAVIVSAQFAQKRTLARHRLVNGALKAEIAAIHAWTPRCFTPEEWEVEVERERERERVMGRSEGKGKGEGVVPGGGRVANGEVVEEGTRG